MALTYSTNTTYTGRNVWTTEGAREICINYDYMPLTGYLKYAAVIHRMSETDGPLNSYGIEQHENTVSERFYIRPVEIIIDADLSDIGLMQNIRYLMCHGPGCKGPRMNTYSYTDTDSETSDTVSMLSVDNEYQVSSETHSLKSVRRMRYYHSGDEPRHIYITLKGRSSNGDVLYGASIQRVNDNPDYIPTKYDINNHFKTAMSRLNKCPVHMKVSKDFKHQLKKNAAHREDITAEIVDEIFTRQGGYLKVRGMRA